MNDKPNVWVIKRRGTKGTAYHLRWLDPRTGKQRSQSCGRDKRRANSMAAVKRQELSVGIDNHIERVTWAEFVKRVLDAKRATVGGAQAIEIERVLRQFGDYAQPKSPHSATRESVLAFLKYRSGKAARGTVEKNRKDLHAAFNEGKRLRLVSESPLDDVRRIKVSARDWHLYEAVEVDALLQRADSRFWEPLIYLAYTTALRQGELLNLTWADVDIDRLSLTVSPKARSTKLLEFTPKDHDLRALPLPDHGAVMVTDTYKRRRRSSVGRATAF
jgi:integrase